MFWIEFFSCFMWFLGWMICECGGEIWCIWELFFMCWFWCIIWVWGEVIECFWSFKCFWSFLRIWNCCFWCRFVFVVVFVVFCMLLMRFELFLFGDWDSCFWSWMNCFCVLFCLCVVFCRSFFRCWICVLCSFFWVFVVFWVDFSLIVVYINKCFSFFVVC